MKKGSFKNLKTKDILKRSIPVVLIIAAMAVIMAVYGKELLMLLSKPENIKGYIESKGIYGVFIYILFQIVQIVIAVIPGEPIQIAGGYIYGTVLGFIYAEIGIMIGSFIAFFISRKFGIPIIRMLVSEKKLMEYKEKLESKKGIAITFILCLIPGIPKDVIVYASGLTPIRFKLFFIIYFAARMPAMFMASYMGAQLGKNNIAGFVTIGIVAVAMLVLGYLYKDKIYNIIKK
jgi:uncharacterized membrane protein YdjX (TVP38/TMEM64 family)